MITEEKKRWAVELLQEKYKELERFPKLSDFEEPTRSRIKAFLGPWPRALEAAGIKQPKVRTATSKNRKKKQSKSQMNLPQDAITE